MGSPSNTSSMACCQPSFGGRRKAPTIVGTPMRTSGKAKVADSAAMRKSQAAAAVSP